MKLIRTKMRHRPLKNAQQQSVRTLIRKLQTRMQRAQKETKRGTNIRESVQERALLMRDLRTKKTKMLTLMTIQIRWSKRKSSRKMLKVEMHAHRRSEATTSSLNHARNKKNWCSCTSRAYFLQALIFRVSFSKFSDNSKVCMKIALKMA